MLYFCNHKVGKYIGFFAVRSCSTILAKKEIHSIVQTSLAEGTFMCVCMYQNVLNILCSRKGEKWKSNEDLLRDIINR